MFILFGDGGSGISFDESSHDIDPCILRPINPWKTKLVIDLAIRFSVKKETKG